MAIETVQAYQCRCDRCAKGYNTEGEDHAMIWANRDDLLEWLKNEENWVQIGDGWYCSTCVEWNDNDELVVKAK